MNLCHIFVVVAFVVGTNALYLLPEKQCPPVSQEEYDNRVCTYNSDCAPSQKCCYTACMDFRNSCVVDGREFRHHGVIPPQLILQPDQCGTCFCVDGSPECYIRRCARPGEPEVVS